MEVIDQLHAPAALPRPRKKSRAFQKELYNGIPNVTVWRVLRKTLHLKAYKLSIVQRLETPFTAGGRHIEL
jgi:hypothetical protein